MTTIYILCVKKPNLHGELVKRKNLKKKQKKKIYFIYFLFVHKKYQGRPHFARVGGIPETRVLFCLALVALNISTKIDY